MLPYLDSSKAHNVLHWTPRFRFEDALQSTIQWYRDYFSRT